MLPQQQLQLQKPSTMISPFSLPPIFIIVKKKSCALGRQAVNLTISIIQMILSHKKARLPSFEQAILLMISPLKQAIQLIVSTLLSTVQ